MATAHEDAASGGRRRNLSWVTLFCVGSRRERGQEAAAAAGTTTPWERSRRRRKKRTVPVDGDLLAGKASDSEVMRHGTGTGTDEEESRKRKGLRLPGCCCFLAPARAPGLEHSTMDSSSSGRNKQRRPERTEQPPPAPRRSRSDKNSPSEASRIQATGGSTSNSSGRSRSRGAEQPRSAPAEPTRASTKQSKAGAGVGAFGPVVGLSVVVAVSMAGLLGGRLWAVACVCAWLAVLFLSRLRRRKAMTAAAGEAAVDVDPTDHRKTAVFRGLLERDRRKAMAA